MKLDDLLRASAVLAVLIAGSCAPTNDVASIKEDGEVNHPIMVEPSFRDLKVSYSGPADGMNPDDAARFDAFVAEYRLHGNGSLGISVPAGAPSRAAIGYFAERAANSGIARDKILVSTHGVSGNDYRIDVSYITYSAHTDECGDWSENLAFTGDNLTPKNFGCSVQHNVAAMVADPRDLLGPRPMDAAANTDRGQVILDLYKQGKITSADKRKTDLPNEQSARAAEVGQ